MEAHKVDPSRWPHYLTPQLSGKAQLAIRGPSNGGFWELRENEKRPFYSGMTSMKNLTRWRFRSAARNEGESNRELAVRMMDWQGKWLRECKSMEDIREAVGKEQFLNSLPMDKRLWVV